MAREAPLDVVRSMLTGWSKGDMWAGREHYAENVLFTSDWPEGSAGGRGVEHLTRFMLDFLEQWDSWRVEGRSFVELTKDTIVAEGRTYGAGTMSRMEIESPWCGIFVFRGGKIAELHVHHDRRKALAAAGLSEAAVDTG